MKQYIRTTNGKSVLDYSELDTAARINFLEDAKRTAANIKLDLSDTDLSNAEKAEALNDAAKLEADHAFAYLETDDGEDVEVDSDTKQMFIEKIISELSDRYNVEVA